jgi:scyllo-inositol 2-dehydrogenase (NADP+)
MDMIKVGLIGYGMSGSVFHAPFFKAGKVWKVTRIVTSRKDKAEVENPGAKAVDSAGEVFADPDIDLVVIATPQAMHYEMAKMALLAGKHVVVEKPFVVHAQDAEELIRLAKEKGLVLTVYQNRRWDADFLTIRKLVNDGTLGDIYYFEAQYDRYRPEVANRWQDQDREGSGTLYNLGSHLIDQAVALFGCPDTVDADVDIQRDGGHAPDYFHILLGFGKRKVVLRSSYMVMKPGPRFQVHGTGGSFLKYGFDPQEDALAAGKSPDGPDWGREHEDLYGELTVEENGKPVSRKIASVPGNYGEFYRLLADAVSGNGEVPVKPEDAAATIRIIELAMQSSREKKAVPFQM